jgi:hypothetical protein
VALGEEVGDAYIEVSADTRPFRREMRRAAAQAAREFPREFSRGMDSQMDSEMTRVGRRVRGTLSRQGRLSGINFADEFTNNVRGRVEAFDRDLARSMTFGNWSDLTDQFDDFDEAIEKTRARIEQLGQQERISAATRRDALSSLDKYIADTQQSQAYREERLAREKERRDQEALAREILALRERERVRNAAERAEQERLAREILAIRQRERMTEEARAREINALNERERIRADGERRDQERLAREILALQRRREAEEREIERAREAVRGLGRDFDLFGGMVGSRNNFIHTLGAIGRTTQNVFKGIAGLFTGESGIHKAVKKFRDLIELEGGVGPALKLLRVDLISLALSVASAALAFTALGGVIVGSLGAGIMGLLGIITALAATLTYGLSGALLAAGPLVLGLVAGIATLATAFSELDGRLDQAVAPMKAWFEETRRGVQDRLFDNLSEQIKGLIPVMERFVGPLMLNTADALRQAGDDFVAALNSEGITSTLSTLGETLPSIMGNLAGSLFNLLEGLLGFFAAIAPNVQGISGTLLEITQRFSDWANSAEGQTSIRDFFSKAWEAAVQLKDLVGALTESLAILFDQTNADGQTMIEKLTGIIDEFNRWAESEEGRQQIADWMEGAKSLARDLKDLIADVGLAIARLDTPENRAALSMILAGLGQLVDAAAWFGRTLTRAKEMGEEMGTTLSQMMATIGRLARPLLAPVVSAFEDIIDVIGRVVGAISRIKWPSPPSNLKDAMKLVVPGFASGGVLTGPRHILAGEDGPEAIVPLRRDLSRVDPSVRALSAVAQGLPGYASGGMVGGGITVESGAIQVVSPSKNPVIVAEAVLDAFAAAAA